MKSLIVAAAFAGLVTGSAVGQQPSAPASGSSNSSVQAGQAGADVKGSASAQQSGQNDQAAGNTSASANTAGMNANAGINVEAELTKGLDAKKAKVGDPVMAKCTKQANGKGDLRIPKNAKLIGHVTEVQARGKGQGESTLAIMFDKAQMKDGREIPVQAVIQAIAAPPSMTMESDNTGSANDSMNAPSSAGRSGGGALSGVNSTVNSTTSAAAGTAGNVAGNTASAAGNVGSQVGAATNGAAGANSSIGAASTGVIGLKGLQLDTSAASGTQASVIRSSSDNVRLESGTRLVLRLITQ
jgi:hypothetical protein